MEIDVKTPHLFGYKQEQEIPIYPFSGVGKDGFSTRNEYITFNTHSIQRAWGNAKLKVTVEYLGYIKQTLGVEQGEQVELKDDALVRDLLTLLAEKHGEPFKKAVYEPNGLDLKPHHILSVNGLLLNQLNGIETKLEDGDRVVLMPVVTGG